METFQDYRKKFDLESQEVFRILGNHDKMMEYYRYLQRVDKDLQLAPSIRPSQDCRLSSCEVDEIMCLETLSYLRAFDHHSTPYFMQLGSYYKCRWTVSQGYNRYSHNVTYLKNQTRHQLETFEYQSWYVKNAAKVTFLIPASICIWFVKGLPGFIYKVPFLIITSNLLLLTGYHASTINALFAIIVFTVLLRRNPWNVLGDSPPRRAIRRSVSSIISQSSAFVCFWQGEHLSAFLVLIINHLDQADLINTECLAGVYPFLQRCCRRLIEGCQMALGLIEEGPSQQQESESSIVQPSLPKQPLSLSSSVYAWSVDYSVPHLRDTLFPSPESSLRNSESSSQSGDDDQDLSESEPSSPRPTQPLTPILIQTRDRKTRKNQTDAPQYTKVVRFSHDAKQGSDISQSLASSCLTKKVNPGGEQIQTDKSISTSPSVDMSETHIQSRNGWVKKNPKENTVKQSPGGLHAQKNSQPEGASKSAPSNFSWIKQDQGSDKKRYQSIEMQTGKTSPELGDSWTTVGKSSNSSQVQYQKKVLKESTYANTFALLNEKEVEEHEPVSASSETPYRLSHKAPIDRMERRKWEAAKRQAAFTWQKTQQAGKEGLQKTQYEPQNKQKSIEKNLLPVSAGQSKEGQGSRTQQAEDIKATIRIGDKSYGAQELSGSPIVDEQYGQYLVVGKKRINLQHVVSVLGGQAKRDRNDGQVKYNVGGLDKYIPDLKRLPQEDIVLMSQPELAVYKEIDEMVPGSVMNFETLSQIIIRNVSRNKDYVVEVRRDKVIVGMPDRQQILFEREQRAKDSQNAIMQQAKSQIECDRTQQTRQKRLDKAQGEDGGRLLSGWKMFNREKIALQMNLNLPGAHHKSDKDQRAVFNRDHLDANAWVTVLQGQGRDLNPSYRKAYKEDQLETKYNLYSPLSKRVRGRRPIALNQGSIMVHLRLQGSKDLGIREGTTHAAKQVWQYPDCKTSFSISAISRAILAQAASSWSGVPLQLELFREDGIYYSRTEDVSADLPALKELFSKNAKRNEKNSQVETQEAHELGRERDRQLKRKVRPPLRTDYPVRVELDLDGHAKWAPKVEAVVYRVPPDGIQSLLKALGRSKESRTHDDRKILKATYAEVIEKWEMSNIGIFNGLPSNGSQPIGFYSNDIRVVMRSQPKNKVFFFKNQLMNFSQEDLPDMIKFINQPIVSAGGRLYCTKTDLGRAMHHHKNPIDLIRIVYREGVEKEYYIESAWATRKNKLLIQSEVANGFISQLMLGYQQNKLSIQEVIDQVSELLKLELGVSFFYPQFRIETFLSLDPADLIGIKKAVRSDILRSDYTHKDRRPATSLAPADLNVGQYLRLALIPLTHHVSEGLSFLRSKQGNVQGQVEVELFTALKRDYGIEPQYSTVNANGQSRTTLSILQYDFCISDYGRKQDVKKQAVSKLLKSGIPDIDRYIFPNPRYDQITADHQYVKPYVVKLQGSERTLVFAAQTLEDLRHQVESLAYVEDGIYYFFPNVDKYVYGPQWEVNNRSWPKKQQGEMLKNFCQEIYSNQDWGFIKSYDYFKGLKEVVLVDAENVPNHPGVQIMTLANNTRIKHWPVLIVDYQDDLLRDFCDVFIISLATRLVTDGKRVQIVSNDKIFKALFHILPLSNLETEMPIPKSGFGTYQFNNVEGLGPYRNLGKSVQGYEEQGKEKWAIAWAESQIIDADFKFPGFVINRQDCWEYYALTPSLPPQLRVVLQDPQAKRLAGFDKATEDFRKRLPDGYVATHKELLRDHLESLGCTGVDAIITKFYSRITGSGCSERVSKIVGMDMRPDPEAWMKFVGEKYNLIYPGSAQQFDCNKDTVVLYPGPQLVTEGIQHDPTQVQFHVEYVDTAPRPIKTPGYTIIPKGGHHVEKTPFYYLIAGHVCPGQIILDDDIDERFPSHVRLEYGKKSNHPTQAGARVRQHIDLLQGNNSGFPLAEIGGYKGQNLRRTYDTQELQKLEDELREKGVPICKASIYLNSKWSYGSPIRQPQQSNVQGRESRVSAQDVPPRQPPRLDAESLCVPGTNVTLKDASQMISAEGVPDELLEQMLQAGRNKRYLKKISETERNEVFDHDLPVPIKLCPKCRVEAGLVWGASHWERALKHHGLEGHVWLLEKEPIPGRRSRIAYGFEWPTAVEIAGTGIVLDGELMETYTIHYLEHTEEPLVVVREHHTIQRTSWYQRVCQQVRRRLKNMGPDEGDVVIVSDSNGSCDYSSTDRDLRAKGLSHYGGHFEAWLGPGEKLPFVLASIAAIFRYFNVTILATLIEGLQVPRLLRIDPENGIFLRHMHKVWRDNVRRAVMCVCSVSSVAFVVGYDLTFERRQSWMCFRALPLIVSTLLGAYLWWDPDIEFRFQQQRALDKNGRMSIRLCLRASLQGNVSGGFTRLPGPKQFIKSGHQYPSAEPNDNLISKVEKPVSCTCTNQTYAFQQMNYPIGQLRTFNNCEINRKGSLYNRHLATKLTPDRKALNHIRVVKIQSSLLSRLGALDCPFTHGAMLEYLQAVKDKDGEKYRNYSAAWEAYQKEGWTRKDAHFEIISKTGEVSSSNSHRPRMICVPSFKYRVLGGLINHVLQQELKRFPWSVCGKTPLEYDDSVTTRSDDVVVSMDGSSHDSHMHYQIQRRIMGPILKIIRRKMEQSGLFTNNAIDDLLNIKDRMLQVRSKTYGMSSYRVRGTIFSGFWGTYTFNTLIVATQNAHLTGQTLDTLRGLVSGDDSSIFINQNQVPKLLEGIDKSFLSAIPANKDSYGLGQVVKEVQISQHSFRFISRHFAKQGGRWRSFRTPEKTVMDGITSSRAPQEELLRQGRIFDTLTIGQYPQSLVETHQGKLQRDWAWKASSHIQGTDRTQQEWDSYLGIFPCYYEWQLGLPYHLDEWRGYTSYVPKRSSA